MKYCGCLRTCVAYLLDFCFLQVCCYLHYNFCYWPNDSDDRCCRNEDDRDHDAVGYVVDGGVGDEEDSSQGSSLDSILDKDDTMDRTNPNNCANNTKDPKRSMCTKANTSPNPNLN